MRSTNFNAKAQIADKEKKFVILGQIDNLSAEILAQSGFGSVEDLNKVLEGYITVDENLISAFKTLKELDPKAYIKQVRLMLKLKNTFVAKIQQTNKKLLSQTQSNGLEN